MRLLRLSEVETSSKDRVFRHPPMRPLIVWLAVFAGDAGMFFYAYTRKWKPGYIFGPFLLLFLALTLRYVTARFHPSNWLVQMNETGLYVHYRSYLNYRLPADDPSVVFISYGEIASARLVRERAEVPRTDGEAGTMTQTFRYVELELAGDFAPLTQALEAEAVEQAPKEKRWYGSSSTLYGDYPATMNMPPFLRIHWDVVPRAKKFLDLLRPYTVIADPVLVTQNFAHLEALSRDEQQQRLRELARRGETISAMYAARRLYGCSLAEAKEMVEGARR